jgi:hypothetical protein
MRLPTFLVVGVAKGGTTSLHYYLRQHPDVFVAPAKEVNYYRDGTRESGRAVPRTLDEYARHFAAAGPAHAIGEISPQYINSPTAADRIAADLPDVRIVVSLRDPAARAYSDYVGRVRVARESRPIGEAIRSGERIYEHGFYYPRLKRFYDRFPREHIHVILHHELSHDTRTTVRTLFRFLGVDPAVAIDTATRRNPAEAPRSPALNRMIWSSLERMQPLIPARIRGAGLLEPLLRKTYRPAPPCPPDLRRRLVEAYRDDIASTSTLIERDLSAWLRIE